MSSRRDVVPLSVLLESLRAHASATSLRATASEVGISPNGLRNLLAGATPHAGTLRKLTTWYLELHSRASDKSQTDLYLACLRFLSSGLPADQRRALERDILDSIREHYTAAGIPAPPWSSGL